jgi:putative RNA 2'-phosphotransferase
MLSGRQRTKLSKFISLILRHRPGKFGVTLDDQGTALLDDLVAAIAAQPSWGWVTADHVRCIAETDGKGRFEILPAEPERIRATYGHSVTVGPEYPSVEPPVYLYHGTPRRAVDSIMAAGLQSRGRQYVHLSATAEEARAVGRRRDPQPVVLRIRAREARQAGVTFYQATDRLYLVESLDSEFLDAM